MQYCNILCSNSKSEENLNKYLYIFYILFFTFFVGCGPVQSKSTLKSKSFHETNLECPLQFKISQLCAQVIPQQERNLVIKRNKFKLLFWNSQNGTNQGPFVETGYSIDVVPWMRMPNGEEHGTSRKVIVTSKIVENGNFEYDLDEVRFTMQGVWQLKIRLMQNGTILDEAIQFLNI